MPELTKKPLTDGNIEFCCKVSRAQAPALQKALEGVLELLEDSGAAYSIEEVFPDYGPGQALRGARQMAGLTQQELADRIGAAKSHISEMERGKRSIGKNMAKRLARALEADYKVFL
jgi:ribosome-binding protein aMBF1 (putative translation factor)